MVLGQFSKTLKFGVPKANSLKILHWLQCYITFYQELLHLGGHIPFRALLLNYPANVMTCATLEAILFTKTIFGYF